MEIITLGNHKFVAGMTWRLLEGVNPSSEAKAISVSNKMLYGLRLSSLIEGEDGSESLENHFVGLCEEKESNGIPSAAGTLSEVAENVILVEKLSSCKLLGLRDR